VETVLGGVRMERLLIRAQHLATGFIDTTLEEISMDTADIRQDIFTNILTKREKDCSHMWMLLTFDRLILSGGMRSTVLASPTNF
jgi:hypothetical protein